MADLTTSYMGLPLRNPILAGSSGLTRSLDGIKRCEQAGVGGVVLKSIFEEQFLLEEGAAEHAALHPEALDYIRRGGLLEYAPRALTDLIEKAKKEVDLPIIASINCQSEKLWPRFARQIQDAGADGLELNIYTMPVDLETPGAAYEDRHVQILEAVRDEVTIPVSVKLHFQITSVAHLGYRLARSGCSGLVLFNWFLRPDIDVQNLKTVARKGKGDLFQSLRWVALLAGRVGCDVAGSGGIRTAEDVVKHVLAGAAAVQVCSLFYEKGLEQARRLCEGLEAWMAAHRYRRLEDFRGELSFKTQSLSFKDRGEAEGYLRAQYVGAYARKE
ncbi:MAG: dihydroorotate dehydrogenase-like protein [Candidatus Aminicenantales bacterium]